ncbi:carbohydrate-binding module family 48 protein [Baudoinia panamericana UAMH 10762]|uniref:Carbohydrate-binding module family 48 protein n=1 Tax=Baudoinia panamericana (strain UAMH 10762) TaxID=717646 RepID=M2ML80_BAUPA|nr:carbohydrate-binding module family 48 protein [Baudoinia panamericana UAMH 10762]EMC92128.1 carbohydrate-binding module family 48 protein [Baudoinia panamericana UAMH 10762]
MGSYNFRWEHPAEEVYVTGTFDNWSKTIKLDKKGTLHEKTVPLPSNSPKILYKFVADGNWSHDHTAKTETDDAGNVNNVLYPSDIQQTRDPASAFTSSVAPGASTTAMAGSQPLEHTRSPPGAFPQTPAADDEQTFSVNPLPATGGIGNPIHLQPGEKVPHPSTFTGNADYSAVRLDEASYNRPDSGAPVLPPALTPTEMAEAAGTKSIFGGLGPVGGTMIPESSMAMGADAPAPIESNKSGPVSSPPAISGTMLSSVAPGSTTQQLAGLQPLEPRGGAAASPPPVVEESQHMAHVDPEASANPTALQEKSAMEQELESKVPEAPATSESTTGGVSAALLSGGALGNTTQQMAGQQPLESRGTGASPPAVVEESQHIAHADPEASANPTAVQEKSAMEQELESKVPEAPATSESTVGGVSGALLSGGALGSTLQQMAGQQPRENRGTAQPPHVVEESQHIAHADPEASANPTAVQEKSAMEQELESKVPEAPAASESTGGVLGMAAAGVTAAGAAAAGAAYMARNKATEATGRDPVSFLPKSVQDSINNMNQKGSVGPSFGGASFRPQTGSSAFSDSALPQQTAVGEGVKVPAEANHERTVADEVPQEVLSSQKEAKWAPEATTNKEAVHEKSAMEQELMRRVPETEQAGEPAPSSVAAALSSTGPEMTSTTKSATSGAPQLADPTSGVAALSMDDKEPISSGSAAAAGTMASGTTTARTPAPDSAAAGTTSSGLNAPASEPAVPPTQKFAQLSTPTPANEKSRDVSPMTRPSDMTTQQPQVTTGVQSSKAPAESKSTTAPAAAPVTAGKPIGTPRGTGMTNSTPEKRQSFMGRMSSMREKGTPESQKSVKSTGSAASESSKAPEKKKGFLKRLAEKLK